MGPLILQAHHSLRKRELEIVEGGKPCVLWHRGEGNSGSMQLGIAVRATGVYGYEKAGELCSFAGPSVVGL